MSEEAQSEALPSTESGSVFDNPQVETGKVTDLGWEIIKKLEGYAEDFDSLQGLNELEEMGGKVLLAACCALEQCHTTLSLLYQGLSVMAFTSGAPTEGERAELLVEMKKLEAWVKKPRTPKT